MMGAAIIQHYIYKQSPCGYSAATCADADGNALVPNINVWIQTPVYFLIALSEVLAAITSLEYAFTKGESSTGGLCSNLACSKLSTAPKSMRGMIQAIFLLTTAIANAITEAFVPLATDPLVVWSESLYLSRSRPNYTTEASFRNRLRSEFPDFQET